ncbi:uncharacterized protein LOC131153259 [Malania oleifera]|uniref:uncharacterized protein LOC131153259 n=1 Tax=Malania oleifera TaxID=397392 RepID=UPI0025AECA00|nr:uncharacterized protein LOC131153259 [Malania oleifera]
MAGLTFGRLSPSLHKSKSMRFLFCSYFSGNGFDFTSLPAQSPALHNSCSVSSSIPLCHLRGLPMKSSSALASSVTLRPLSTKSPEEGTEDNEEDEQNHQYEEGDIIDEWEEEDDTEPEIGDGGDGGGVVLQNVPWGERVLCIAREVLLQFGDDMKLFAFKTTPRGYIYVRLDKLSNKYGCPSMVEIEGYNQQYKKRLDETGALGEIPDDLAVEVSSPGAERILKVPDDLHRFKDMPMRVCYVEDVESKQMEKDGIFLLESIDLESESCEWKLANVKENRDLLSKGRLFSRKMKDWRLKLPYAMCTKVTLYLEY